MSRDDNTPVLVRVCLKVQYLMMFVKRGYFDHVVSHEETAGEHDPRRVVLVATVPRKYVLEATAYATYLEKLDTRESLQDALTELVESVRSSEAAIHEALADLQRRVDELREVDHG